MFRLLVILFQVPSQFLPSSFPVPSQFLPFPLKFFISSQPGTLLRSTFLPTHAAMRAQIIFGTRCQIQYALFYFNQGSISGFEIPGRPLWTQRGPQCWESCVTVWPLWDLCKSRDHVIAAISSILLAPSLRTQWACHSPNSWPNEVVRTKVCDAHLSIETAVILPDTKSCWSGGSLRIMNP